jgi:hypothetical protein
MGEDEGLPNREKAFRRTAPVTRMHRNWKRQLTAALLLLPASAPGWNDAGHRTLALLAYSHLTANARARVGQILTRHPDFASILSSGPTTRADDVTRDAFLTAATWPDMIRSDPRFGPSASPVSGFRDMDRHTAWHFINNPLPAQFASQPVDPDNGAEKLSALIAALKASGPVTPAEAYALPWIVHIVGDLHQPLHTVARFSSVNGRAVHDRGGNTCFVEGAKNLHSLWDSMLGTATDERSVARLAASLEEQYPMPNTVDRNPIAWVREGVAAATSHVYNFPGACTEATPVQLSASYLAAAKELARERAALAAYRLAAILNDRLGP